MGAAAVPLLVIGGGLQLGTSIAQFSLQRSSAEIQRGEAEVAAKQEELGAEAREGDRKARLASALATQNVSAGAKGIAAFEGSPLTILEADIQAEEAATQRDVFGAEFAAFTKRAGGRTRERLQKQQAAIGLLGDIGGAALQTGFAAK